MSHWLSPYLFTSIYVYRGDFEEKQLSQFFFVNTINGTNFTALNNKRVFSDAQSKKYIEIKNLFNSHSLGKVKKQTFMFSGAIKHLRFM